VGTARLPNNDSAPWPLRDLSDLLSAFRRGQLDDHMREIIDNINSRTETIARERTHSAMARLALHTRVRFDDRVTPQYLRGLTGEIHEISDDRVLVCLDAPAGRFTDGHVRCSPEMLEPVKGT
jgi:hypothetical protein